MISVCLASHNGEKYIKKQIDSILSQLSSQDELIISDDGSTDLTLSIIHRYKDERIKLLHYKQDVSVLRKKHSKQFYLATKNFENALKNAKGDYIFLSDQDDIWLPDRVEVMVNSLKKNDCVMCNLNLIDENDKIIKDNYFESNPVPRNLFTYIIKTHILGCCIAFNRKVLEYVLPFPNNLISHDYWIGCIAVRKFNFTYIKCPLHLYRRTGNNVSTTSAKSTNSFLYKIYYRFVFLCQFLIFTRKKNKGE